MHQGEWGRREEVEGKGERGEREKERGWRNSKVKTKGRVSDRGRKRREKGGRVTKKVQKKVERDTKWSGEAREQREGERKESTGRMVFNESGRSGCYPVCP